MNLLLAGNAQDTRPCQPSYTSHPAPIQKVLCIFMHLYTPLALILLFWLTSVAALACGRSTKVPSLTSIVFISQKERVKSFVVVDSHQGWNHVRSLNCFQCFVKKKSENTQYPRFLFRNYICIQEACNKRIKPRPVSVECFFAFKLCCISRHVWQWWVYFYQLFLHVTQIRLSRSVNRQPPSFILDSFSVKLSLHLFFWTKLTSNSLYPLSRLFFIVFPDLTTVWHCEGISVSCENDQSQEESLM